MIGQGLTCPRCDEIGLDGDQFCEACGHRLEQPGSRGTTDHREIDLGGAAGVTDRGLVHQQNDDALWISAQDGAVAVVICDGVSTSAEAHVAAENAANRAGQMLRDALQRRAESTPGDWDPLAATEEAMAEAQAAVLLVSWAPDGSTTAPSCTFISAVWDGETMAVGWAGDSRAYWIGASTCQQLSVDNSWLQEQLEADARRALAAERDPRTHAITRWLGPDAPNLPPQVARFCPAEHGTLLVCSDGLWNYAPTTEALANLVNLRHAPPIDLARRLVQYALSRGGHDNITVAVVDVAPVCAVTSEREER